MPTYTYKCKECGYKFDKRQSFSDDTLRLCPACGAESGLRKVVNSVGILFKGSGFYVTDNRNGSSAQSAAPGKSETRKKQPEGKETSTTAGSSANGSGKQTAGEKSAAVSA